MTSALFAPPPPTIKNPVRLTFDTCVEPFFRTTHLSLLIHVHVELQDVQCYDSNVHLYSSATSLQGSRHTFIQMQIDLRGKCSHFHLIS